MLIIFEKKSIGIAQINVRFCKTGRSNDLLSVKDFLGGHFFKALALSSFFLCDIRGKLSSFLAAFFLLFMWQEFKIRKEDLFSHFLLLAAQQATDYQGREENDKEKEMANGTNSCEKRRPKVTFSLAIFMSI